MVGDTRSASLELHSQHATLALFSKEGLEFLDLQKTQILKKKQPLELVLAEGMFPPELLCFVFFFLMWIQRKKQQNHDLFRWQANS